MSHYGLNLSKITFLLAKSVWDSWFVRTVTLSYKWVIEWAEQVSEWSEWASGVSEWAEQASGMKRSEWASRRALQSEWANVWVAHFSPCRFRQICPTVWAKTRFWHMHTYGPGWNAYIKFAKGCCSNCHINQPSKTEPMNRVVRVAEVGG